MNISFKMTVQILKMIEIWENSSSNCPTHGTVHVIDFMEAHFIFEGFQVSI